MSSLEVRPFRRSDRDQLTQLVNAHAAAVVPGMSASVSTVLSALERQPGEFIEDPWVCERVTLVADQQDRIAAAAHLLRYFPDERAGTSARDVGEIHWLLFWPEAPAGNPYWPDATEAAGALMAACIRQLEKWRLAGVDRLLDYAWLEGTDPGDLDHAEYRAFLLAAGFRELTRTERGWTRTPQDATG